MKTRYKGYTGKLLDVNLTSQTTGEYIVSDMDRERFLGGRYLSTKILWDELKPGIDPLSPENIFIVMTAPLTGTRAPSTSRYDISAKSPITGGIGHSNSGGNFGIHLKKAGWDGIVIRGSADTPVYIEINDDVVQIKNADHLWGKDTHTSQELMKTNDFKKAATMVIGPAGENLVKFACVVCQERVHGRTGMGSVMGSKNLKGLVVKGSKKIDVFQPEKFKEHTKKWIKSLQGHPATGETVPKLGTSMFVALLQRANALPTKNFSRGTFENYNQITGETLAKDHLIRNYGCQSCPIQCGRVVKLDGQEIKGPEYEIMCLFGANLLINDLDAIIRWNRELDLLGLDGVSCGTVLGFAMELNEKGIWKNNLEFGKKENILDILKLIAHREGIGNDLAEGVKYLSEKYGGTDFAPHVKGLELPAYQPQAAVGHALGYATANRGACHLDGGYMIYFEATGPVTLEQFHHRSKPAWVVLDQNLLAAISSGGSCLFTSWTFVPAIAFKAQKSKIISFIIRKILTYTWPSITGLLKLPLVFLKFHIPLLPHSKAIALATGMDMSFGKLIRIGDRGYTMEKLFNLREGIRKKDDKLAKRFTDDLLVKGNKNSRVQLDKMLPQYYKIRGWDENGVPKEKTLKKLDLNFVDISQLN
ncbi:MAG: aldehyde ferredoxin oxidoreductase family protein [Desulfobacteraceae bacterium]|nr:aldehyde ferredoxin oxidoreductase family protein [Desulfobacteraceae bacterium]MBC2757317.1 aldehyde ferredoxin oxidoreductase family protein [Desulfobacteraceae bacterium]